MATAGSFCREGNAYTNASIVVRMRAVLSLTLGLLLSGISQAEERFIILQSTTSTQNSGLFDAILPRFQSRTGIEVRVVAVGTGQALKNARNGDGDVLLIHAKPEEEAFVAMGWGVKRYDVMYNDFVIVGPADDPAGIAGMQEAGAVLRKIAQTQVAFISRGDESGTHKKSGHCGKSPRLIH